MRLESVEWRSHGYALLVFEEGELKTTKVFRVSDAARAVRTDFKGHEGWYLLRVAKEAKRDFLYQTGGVEAVKAAGPMPLKVEELRDLALAYENARELMPDGR